MLTRVQWDVIDVSNDYTIRTGHVIHSLNTVHANPKLTRQRRDRVSLLHHVAHQIIPQPAGAPAE